ncbi:MAG: HesA/MoeB/ThiF family protein [Acidobacteriota bacterium]
MDNRGALRSFLSERAVDCVLAWADQADAMHRFQVSCADTEEAALEAGILPARYRRNQRMISTAQQLTLFRSTVAVVGCGGLGGFVIEELARLGVGHLVAIDPDTFEEHNLNRQIFSSPATLGRNKALVAREHIAAIHPGVEVAPLQAAFSREQAADMLTGVSVVVDALDSVPDRVALSEACEALQLPLVHGAIAGWYGYVATMLPGDRTLQHIYSRVTSRRGIEAQLGNPAFTPAVVASLEVAEVCKILLGVGSLLRHQLLCVNLLDMEIENIRL